MKVESIAECSHWSILLYFWPGFSDNWSWNPICGIFETCVKRPPFVLHTFYCISCSLKQRAISWDACSCCVCVWLFFLHKHQLCADILLIFLLVGVGAVREYLVVWRFLAFFQDQSTEWLIFSWSMLKFQDFFRYVWYVWYFGGDKQYIMGPRLYSKKTREYPPDRYINQQCRPRWDVTKYNIL